MMNQAGGALLHAAQALLPVLLMMLVAALVAPMLLGGWLLSAQSLAPNFSKLNPIAGIGRMFSVESLAELAKTLLKSLLVGGVAWWVIADDLGAIMGLMREPAHAALPHTLHLVAVSCALIIASLLLVAGIDVPYQLWSHARKLRMSREDLRQENKESEGDPHVKAQIRRQQQQMAKRRMMAEVPKADIIVTNPTHFAVALKYVDKDMRAPRVIAKGTDLVALRIRAMAEEHKIPVLEAPPLTRALYRHTKLGDEIPAALYSAVAEVLAWAYQLQRAAEGGATPPRAPRDLPVPESLDPQAAPAASNLLGERRMTLVDDLMRLPRQMMAGGKGKGLAGPVLIILILSMMVLPLPPFLLDLLFTFNIALSIMVLLVSMYTMKALDFAAFPAVLAIRN